MCSDQDMISASYVDIFNRMRRDVLGLLQATYYSLSLSSRASYVASVHRSTEAVLDGWGTGATWCVIVGQQLR